MEFSSLFIVLFVQQNDAQIGKIMLTELKSHQYKQQMTFSDSDINSNAASLFSNVFLLSPFHSFNNKQHIAEENVIIMGPKKNTKKKVKRNLKNQKMLGTRRMLSQTPTLMY